jgi:mono/diheme cytochrome c family protein
MSNTLPVKIHRGMTHYSRVKLMMFPLVCAAMLAGGLMAAAIYGQGVASPRDQALNTLSAAGPAPEGEPRRGRSLFDRNCAHCHGNDARGDEGPSLHNLTLSDARIAKRIKDGIKGEMPRFGAKLNDADVEALIAYLRTLKN